VTPCFCTGIYNGSLLDKDREQYFWEYWLAKTDYLVVLNTEADGILSPKMSNKHPHPFILEWSSIFFRSCTVPETPPPPPPPLPPPPPQEKTPPPPPPNRDDARTQVWFVNNIARTGHRDDLAHRVPTLNTVVDYEIVPTSLKKPRGKSGRVKFWGRSTFSSRSFRSCHARWTDYSQSLTVVITLTWQDERDHPTNLLDTR